MYKLFVALRYLRRNWLNLVGVLAVAIGVAVLICVLSVMKGFDEEFRSRIRATLSDLIVESWTDDSFDDYEAAMAKMQRIPHVVACAPQYEGLGLIRIGKQSRYCEFHGVDLKRELEATDFGEYWRAWRGRAARDELAALVPAEGGPLPVETAQQAAQLLSQMRRQDYELLDSALRERLRLMCKQYEFAFADAALPEWGAVEDPAKESPAFGGGELLVIGQDPLGRPVRVEVGQQVILMTAADIFEGRVVRRCRIVGEFRSGLYDYDLRNIYLPLIDVQRMMNKPGRVTSINIRLDSFDNAPEVRAALLGILTPDEIAEGIELIRPYLTKEEPGRLRKLEEGLRDLRARLPNWFAEGNPRAAIETRSAETVLYAAVADALKAGGTGTAGANLERLKAFKDKTIEREEGQSGRHFRVSTWEDKRRTFLRAVWLERRIMGFILFFVMLIAGFLILSILHTTVLSKTRDIGILKSIGGSMRGIMSIFLLDGLLIGIIGSVLGTTGGMLITGNINQIEGLLKRLVGFRLFPPDIYYLERIPVDQHPWPSAVAICFTAILISLLASAYPAWKAARMDPVEALRHE